MDQAAAQPLKWYQGLEKYCWVVLVISALGWLFDTMDQNLFNLRTNLRYGCIILRHYLDIERGDTFRALGRYNGSLGKSRYPNAVLRAWSGKWDYRAGDRVIATPTVYAGESR